MIVISDTTPLNYLILIDQATLLRQLYEVVIIPEAVFNEMIEAGTPQIVRDWILDKPRWIDVREVPPTPESELQQIEAGEREAILLAEHLKADLVLLDDLRARRVAKGRGLSVVGTLGILADASRRGLLDLHDAIAALRKTNFRVSDKLIEALLDSAT